MQFQAQNIHQNADLMPVLSQKTIEYHYGKHHCGYARTLNALVENTEFAGRTLEEIILQSRGVDQKIFNNAAQLFNHDFYWRCLKIHSERPIGKLRKLVEAQFASFEEFEDQYITYANTMFGSGWSWLVLENGRLAFFNSQNAETPVGTHRSAICVIDLWEHAYYIDYYNDRALYISRIIKECINWKFCESQLDACASYVTLA
ncbi:MAG: superoxide dismutase [Holosporaceae bacterium]|jgi:Fe-Mn family superoxide dismutase|nr:superoxide dismutase [Holosporaceae bacterium]